MKKSIIISILLVGILILVGAGCGKKKAEESEVPTGAESTKEEALSLEEIVSKAKNLEGYKFDMHVKSSQMAKDFDYTMWVKGNKVKTETTYQGQNVFYIVNNAEQVAYIYMPSQNIAMKQSFVDVPEETKESPHQESGAILNKDPKVFGTEKIDGKTCLKVKYTDENQDTTSTTWLWVQNGLPIKTEVTNKQGAHTVITMSNIEVGEFSDSDFELPDGVRIIESPITY